MYLLITCYPISAQITRLSGESLICLRYRSLGNSLKSGDLRLVHPDGVAYMHLFRGGTILACMLQALIPVSLANYSSP